MPRESLFSREEIISSAFVLFVEKGINAISARRIASRLNCSTAPVYTAFSSMDELKSVLIRKSLDLLLHYTKLEYTPHAFLNIGVGMLEFAKNHKHIYRTLFLETNDYKSLLVEFTARNLEQMKKDTALKSFNEDDLKGILHKLTVYTHGLAALLCAELLEDTSQDNLIQELQGAGGDIIGATAFWKGNLSEYLEGAKIHEKDHDN